MALLDILKYPDPRLHKVAAPVAVVDERVRMLVQDMFETMEEAHGVGLAATQVDVHERIIVGLDTRSDPPRRFVLINPEIVERSPDIVFDEEGCLSVPSIYDRVGRHASVTVRALDEQGQAVQMQADGLTAVVIQHEMDHLVGKVFVEYLSPLKRDRIRTKMLKRTRESQRA